MKCAEATINDLDELISLGKKLWPELENEELRTTFNETFYRPTEITFILRNENQLAGLAIFSIRSEYVEGALSSPVGYLEAIVIDEAFRRQGLAGELLEHGTAWCRSKGCTQLGSDVEIGNEQSQQFHARHDFRETNRLVTYIKDIK